MIDGEAALELILNARLLVIVRAASPGFDESVHRWARDQRVLHIPGVMTPTEVARAIGAGAGLIKLFPAGTLGVGYLRQSGGR